MAGHPIEFRTLAIASDWNDTALFDMFNAGLADRIKDEMAARKLPESFNSLIEMTINIDRCMRERERERVNMPRPNDFRASPWFKSHSSPGTSYSRLIPETGRPTPHPETSSPEPMGSTHT